MTQEQEPGRTSPAADHGAELQRLRDALQPVPAEVEPWLDDACLARFLRADGGDFDKAKARLEGTVRWRAETRPELISCTACSKDPHAHYMYQVSVAHWDWLLFLCVDETSGDSREHQEAETFQRCLGAHKHSGGLALAIHRLTSPGRAFDCIYSADRGDQDWA